MMVMDEDEEANNLATHHELLKNRMTIQNNVVNKRKVSARIIISIQVLFSLLPIMLIQLVRRRSGMNGLVCLVQILLAFFKF
jgi:hypothetical protein